MEDIMAQLDLACTHEHELCLKLERASFNVR